MNFETNKTYCYKRLLIKLCTYQEFLLFKNVGKCMLIKIDAGHILSKGTSDILENAVQEEAQ